MKNHIKTKFTYGYLFLAMLSSTVMALNSTTHAITQNSPAPTVLPNHNHYNLEASLKIKCFSKTAQDTIQLYREIGATTQEIAAPYMFLSFLGHPNYPALSTDKSLCIFIYSSPPECERKYVFLAKLQTPNLKKLIETLGWGVEDHQDWTFFTQYKDDFKLIKDKQSLVSFANEASKADIEFKMQPTIVSLTKLTGDKELKDVLNNLDSSVWQINLPEGQITLDGLLVHKLTSRQNLGSWFDKYGNRWGAKTKVVHPNSKESKVSISLERKDVPCFFNQLKAKVLSMNAQ